MVQLLCHLVVLDDAVAMCYN